MKLTAEQEEAVSADRSGQLLVAGAGTGKTTVMAQRILHLVSSGQVRADQVLGLTFTNKAAAHLKAKVREALGADADVTVGTYHSFGASLVADHALELDLHPDTRILNRAQAWQLLYGVFDEFRFQHRKTLYPQNLLDHALTLASRCADHLVPIGAVIEDCERIVASTATQKIRDTAAMRQELCQVVAAYGRRKRERHLLDFGDQIALAVRLLADRPELADALRDQHPVVLLDEYQDTNFAQRRLLQLIYPPGSCVTAVGDDMQSIYGFRGAHLANILRFKDHFAPVTVRQLQTTFRFGPRLVELSNRIQDKVKESLPKVLTVPEDAPDTTITCFLAADDSEEAATIADDVAKAVTDGVPCGDTAVLCRKRRLIPPVVAALEERGIAVEVVGASGLLDRPEVVDLVSWLQLLADGSATVALLRILQGPRYRIGLRDLAAVSRYARTNDTSWLAALADPHAVPDLSIEAARRLRGFEAERAALSAAATRMPVLELAEAVVERTGLWRAAGDLGRENLLRFLDLAEGFTPVEGDPGLRAFVEYLQLLDESDDDLAEAHLTDADAVKVMTIHQAKGLEFDVVYVPGLAGKGRSQIFPDGRAGENALTNSSALPWWLREDDGIPTWPGATQKAVEEVIKRRRLDEEWRLLYVACTRAKRRLVCSAAHWYPGPAEAQGPSEFYEFVAGQTDLVTELFRHEAATVDPDVAAKERQRAASRRYADQVAPRPDAAPIQLRLDVVDTAVPAAARVAPPALSVTGLVTYARCPKQFYWTVVRPLPRRSSAAARLGTEIHRWIEQRAGRQLILIEPEAPDADELDPDRFPAGTDVAAGLRASFLSSAWADLDPVRVEAPFVLAVGGHLVRGRIDAVYERDGRLELVDFKTGRPATEGDKAAGTQLDLYGLAAVDAWAAEPDRLRTTYCYLRTDGPPIVVSSDWDAATLAAVRARLASTLDALAEARFGTTPGRWCRGCDFLSFCPAGKAEVGG
ncbi:MAG: ATP-dependent DNA helicase SCO5184 [uncultured Acidimicrobiales bacterium]|uniref:DNA 3'-5' helicase n=1 Tax=uncultured Acidimicrobiales bacterium TaxID=310071 RepID=A0A6J4HTY3_9ACTN|nr:MAG: ATP-dependent DNA helicase SCO5184 [uncultured Acidimicrobiales bacterium]